MSPSPAPKALVTGGARRLGREIVEALVDLCASPAANQRKGGLMGLASGHPKSVCPTRVRRI